MCKLSWYPALCMSEKQTECFEHFLARKLSRDYADLFAEHRKWLFRSGSTVSQGHEDCTLTHCTSRCLFIYFRSRDWSGHGYKAVHTSSSTESHKLRWADFNLANYSNSFPKILLLCALSEVAELFQVFVGLEAAHQIISCIRVATHHPHRPSCLFDVLYTNKALEFNGWFKVFIGS